MKNDAAQNRLSPSNLLNKAARQTIPAFLENGKWKIAEETILPRRKNT